MHRNGFMRLLKKTENCLFLSIASSKNTTHTLKVIPALKVLHKMKYSF